MKTPPSVPAAVEHVEEIRADSLATGTVCSTANSLAVRWTEPNCHGAEISGYNIDFGEEQPLYVGRTNYHILEHLHSDTMYRYNLHENIAIAIILPKIIVSSISSKLYCCVPGYEYKQ